MDAINIAASGLRSQQTRLDTIGTNISNVNTIGYKSTRVDFKDTLYAVMENPEGGTLEENLLRGTGTALNASTVSYAPGVEQATDGPLDFSIGGSGFFVTENAEGGRRYTRCGAFARSPEAEGDFLVTQQGSYVLDDSGARIIVPAGAEIGVAEGGVLTADGTSFANLAIVRFPNEQGLSAAGGTSFTETAASGAPVNVEDASLKQGVLEGSNVDLAQELTLMMRTQRAYSLASQALRTADEMDGLANHMR